MESDPKTDLAAIRTTLAAERTLMAWIRTALSTISFGFTIYKFMHALAAKHERGPRHMGIALASLGTLSLLAGTIEYLHNVRTVGQHRPGFTFYVACSVIAMGLMVLAGIILHVGPLS
ncbi:MAG TPA: DUF202 domain-containing protein [Polyangia bacterium]|nr:DUF202 domain-containing protein [Polyangia bacterium]